MARNQHQPPKKPTTPEPPDDDEDGDDAELSPKQLEAINKAVSSQVGRRFKSFETQITTTIADQFAKLAPAPKADPDDDDEDDADDPPPDKKRRIDPQLAKLNKKLEAQNRQLEEERAARAKEKTAREDALIGSSLTEGLTKLGVDAHRLRGALAVHRAAASVGDDGKVKYKVQRDGYEEDLAPEVALKEWATTDEGKSYLSAASIGGGSGSRAPGAPGPSRRAAPNTPEGRVEAKQAARGQLLSAVGELVGGGSVVIE